MLILTKLTEECGELVQAAAKSQMTLSQFGNFTHWDGDMRPRLEEEIGDVLASCIFTVWRAGLSWRRILARIEKKIALYRQWDF